MTIITPILQMRELMDRTLNNVLGPELEFKLKHLY